MVDLATLLSDQFPVVLHQFTPAVKHPNPHNATLVESKSCLHLRQWCVSALEVVRYALMLLLQETCNQHLNQQSLKFQIQGLQAGVSHCWGMLLNVTSSFAHWRRCGAAAGMCLGLRSKSDREPKGRECHANRRARAGALLRLLEKAGLCVCVSSPLIDSVDIWGTELASHFEDHRLDYVRVY